MKMIWTPVKHHIRYFNLKNVIKHANIFPYSLQIKQGIQNWIYDRHAGRHDGVVVNAMVYQHGGYNLIFIPSRRCYSTLV